LSFCLFCENKTLHFSLKSFQHLSSSRHTPRHASLFRRKANASFRNRLKAANSIERAAGNEDERRSALSRGNSTVTDDDDVDDRVDTATTVDVEERVNEIDLT